MFASSSVFRTDLLRPSSEVGNGSLREHEGRTEGIHDFDDHD